MGIIGHWVSPEFEKRDKLLKFTEINGPYSGENLAEVVLKILDELDIVPKLLTITGDNSTLQQVTKILKPFWDHTNSVSKTYLMIVESLPIYWSLDDLLNEVQNAEGDFEDMSIKIRKVVERGIEKMNKTLAVSPLDPSPVTQIAVEESRERQAVFYDCHLHQLAPARCFDAAVADGTYTVFMTFGYELAVNEQTMASIGRALQYRNIRSRPIGRHF
ncbi:hypothetical protein N7540_013202 [Penicillium herquei]|nr:hypothetical protein N7540_013202 [Penicillium herquei]